MREWFKQDFGQPVLRVDGLSVVPLVGTLDGRYERFLMATPRRLVVERDFELQGLGD